MKVEAFIKLLESVKPDSIIKFDVNIDNIDNGIYIEGRENFNMSYVQNALVIEIE